MGARIDRDYINGEHDTVCDPPVPSRVGTEFGGGVKDKATAIRFRLRDDDGNVYYGGLIDRADVFEGNVMADEGEDGDLLYEIQRWGEYDAGAVAAELRAKDCPPSFVTTHEGCSSVTADRRWVGPYGLPSGAAVFNPETFKADENSHAD